MSALSRLLQRARTHVARTDGVEPYPDLVPLELDLPPDVAYVAALAAVRAMPLWRIAVEDPAARRIAAEATTPRMKFVDDVEIVVESAGRGSRVRVGSTSRVGITDFGTNARRVRAYLSRLATNAPG